MRWFGAGGLALLSTVFLTACSAPAGDTSPTATAAELPVAVSISGVGVGARELDVPEGAQSLVVRLACTEGMFSVMANVHMTQYPLGGCGGMTEVSLPLPTSSVMRVELRIHPESAFVAELEFSAEALEVDPEIAADCEVLGRVISIAFNADRGFELGELDEAAWRADVDAAEAELGTMDPSPMIATQMSAIEAWLTTAEIPGELTTESTIESLSARSLVAQICTGNNSGLFLLGEYGG